MKAFSAYFFYPLTLMVASLAYLLAFQFTHIFLWGAFAAISVSAIMIFAAEKINPLHLEWVPTRDDLVGDVFFYSLFVQVLFPIFLYFAGRSFLEILGFADGVIVDLWPHQLPLIVQFFILAMAGEFFQYWWHRLCHTYTFLWTIHAPHHLPNKLYSWNTSRFHFLDKFVEFFFTLFIFMAIGLSLEIFSYYYVFYAITGYIQHSNLDVRLGWFDYLIASGETHRFHHDSNISKSKCNYANNFVLFDLLFNTFKRDSSEKIVQVGVRSPNIPKGIMEETLYPFAAFKISVFHFGLKLSMKYIAGKKVEKLRAAALQPMKTQHDFLLKLLEENKRTVFGQEHGFEKIRTTEQFKSNVPIRDYEEHRHYIELIFAGKLHALNSLAPHYFTKTSGTTGKPKYIPINMVVQKNYTTSQQILAHSLFTLDPRFLDGEIFSVVGNAYEETLHGQWPCGSMSGKMYTLAHKMIKAKHIFQEDMATLNDSPQKYIYLAALALLSPDTTFYVSPNPSSLLKIFEVINSQKNVLIKLIEEGTDPILKKHSRKFSRALLLLNLNKELTVVDVWPNLRILSLWQEGSCSYLIPKVKKLLGPKTHLTELGYLCSEFYGSLPVDSNTDKQIPTLLDNFFEFIEKNAYESGSRETLELHELKLNAEYYIIVTTSGCFYRYFINDIIKVTGFIGITPTIVFSQKGKGMTNLTGEKISEKQLVSFFENMNHENIGVKFFICLADQVNQRYVLYLEADNDLKPGKIAEELNSYLEKENVEYASKVFDKRLKPIEVVALQPGTSEHYRNHCLKKGQSETQFKFLHLQYLADVDFPFEQYVKNEKKNN
ncbi:MAG: GH3 auxin-responsive promoter family protein [Bacteriovorax sp.]|jgi:sterol desaturase/sphingolipid hydroxylase (fatty acid hydroxylase superfamily)